VTALRFVADGADRMPKPERPLRLRPLSAWWRWLMGLDGPERNLYTRR
jgi:hypothetical protein